VARTGTNLGDPAFLGLLAEGCWRIGRHDDALEALGLGVARAQEQGQHYHDAELHRLRAEILLDRDGGALEEAQTLLRRALEIKRGQEAKSWELRAATSLARLLRDQGQRDDARALLAPVYNWFTEGFDTQDLKDARIGQIAHDIGASRHPATRLGMLKSPASNPYPHCWVFSSFL
jgi:predicted ATPase